MASSEIQWLKKFDAAMRLGRSAQASLSHAASVQYEAGNQILAAHLYRISEAFAESLDNADSAVSQMINEEVKASQNRLNETFLAVLRTTLQPGQVQRPSTTNLNAGDDDE